MGIPRTINFRFLLHLPHVTQPIKGPHNCTNSKEETTNIRPKSLMDDIEAFLAIYIGKYLSGVFEAVDNLSHFINAYRKGKLVDDLTLVHILTLEDINQSVH